MSEDVNNIPVGPDYPLWSLLHTEHGLILLESEVREIMECVREIDRQTIKYAEPFKTPEDILKKNSGLSDEDFTSHAFTMTAGECVVSMKEFANQVPLILTPTGSIKDVDSSEPTTKADAMTLIYEFAEKFNFCVEIY